MSSAEAAQAMSKEIQLSLGPDAGPNDDSTQVGWRSSKGQRATVAISTSGATSNRCPGPTTHRLGPPAGSHELYSMQKRFWGCDPCRLPTASHDANLASWRGDLAASLALSGSRFAVRSWSGCSQILSSPCLEPVRRRSWAEAGALLRLRLPSTATQCHKPSRTREAF